MGVHYLSKMGEIILVAGVIISGITYLTLQLVRTDQVEDTVFISLLVGASFLLTRGLRTLLGYLQSKGRDFYNFILAAEDPARVYQKHSEFIAAIINFKRLTVSGLLYGAGIASSPFLLGVWKGESVLRWSLGAFLFSVNFITGVAFAGLLAFFIHAVKLSKSVKVDLMKIENPSTRFLFDSTRKISVIAAIYIAMSLSSIVFSVLPFGNLVLIYAIFSMAILVATVIVPLYPVMQRMKEAKEKCLYEIDCKLNEAFHNALEEIKTDNPPESLNKFDYLYRIRENIASITVLPFRSKSLTAVVSVVLVSLIPVVVQVILERIL